jgi:mannose-6-phosphate isomerase
MIADSQIVSRGKLAALRSRLVEWLRDAAYPLWSRHGIDARSGGFFETLAQNGTAPSQPRRARVHPRQIYAFAQAAAFGWRGDVRGIVSRGIDYFTAHYLRPDGLFRTLVGADGVPLDEQALLYDQAFALLGYAAAAAALDQGREFERRALDLRHAIEARLGGAEGADGALRSADAAHGAYESNPHMHLLEACMIWSETGNDLGWADWVRDLAELARARFIRAESGALGEAYSPSWQPAPGLIGRIIEPGHQFEWAWLLLRREHLPANLPVSLTVSPLRQAALRLIDVGETYGVHRNVAVNALLDDLTIQDPRARLWPQTERLKASLVAARITGESRYWSMAYDAGKSLLPYLSTATPGLWFDVQMPNGELEGTLVPASTLYHLVGAIAALDKAVAGHA